MFEWDDLRIFLAVARARKIAPAARALSVNATTVMRRLTRLSNQLEARLFEQVGNERILTERGQSLFEHAEIIEGATFAAIRDVSGESRSLSGQVRLSVPEGFASWILARALPSFQAAHPLIELDVITASGFLNPSRRQADMAIMLARPQAGRFVAVKLSNYRLGLYAAQDYLAVNSPPKNVEGLKEHRLIGYVPELVDSPELDYLDEVGSGLTATMRSTSINVQHRIISAGCGIGLLPMFIGRHDTNLLQVLPQLVQLKRSFWLVTHADRRDVARIKAVKQFLRDAVSDNVQSPSE